MPTGVIHLNLFVTISTYLSHQPVPLKHDINIYVYKLNAYMLFFYVSTWLFVPICLDSVVSDKYLIKCFPAFSYTSQKKVSSAQTILVKSVDKSF